MDNLPNVKYRETILSLVNNDGAHFHILCCRPTTVDIPMWPAFSLMIALLEIQGQWFAMIRRETYQNRFWLHCTVETKRAFTYRACIPTFWLYKLFWKIDN